jgi:hypothetical protein
VRNEHSRPLVIALGAWLREQRRKHAGCRRSSSASSFRPRILFGGHARVVLILFEDMREICRLQRLPPHTSRSLRACSPSAHELAGSRVNNYRRMAAFGVVAAQDGA